MSLGWETLTLQMCCAAGYVIRYVTLIHFTDAGKNVKNAFKLSLNAFDEVSSDCMEKMGIDPVCACTFYIAVGVGMGQEG